MSSHGNWLVIAVLVVFSTSATAAPVIVKPGDAAVDGRVIKRYLNRFKLVGRGSDGSTVEMGTWTDTARGDTINGREVLLRKQTWIHDRGAEGYYNVVDHKTLAPIVSQYVNSAGLYRRMEFSPDGKLVHYQLSPQPPREGMPPGKPLRLSDPMNEGDVKLSQSYFDFNTGMFGLLIVGFPLKEGYSARFPVFRSYDPQAEPAWVDFEVKGKEDVPAGSGKTINAWLVVAHSPDTDEVMTFDLVREPPYIIRLRQAWEGREWTFEMVDAPPASGSGPTTSGTAK
jgi:hypothetical protein